jgi:hypothetical protein
MQSDNPISMRRCVDINAEKISTIHKGKPGFVHVFRGQTPIGRGFQKISKVMGIIKWVYPKPANFGKKST